MLQIFPRIDFNRILGLNQNTIYIFQKKISKFDKKFYVQNRGGGVQNVLSVTKPNIFQKKFSKFDKKFM